MLKRAFTLIELLVVIAITAILMTIILVPVIQSFNLTRAAQAFADAQDKARTFTEKVSREINNAVYVRENSGLAGAISIVVPARPGSAQTVAGYDTANPFIRTTIFNAKLDLVPPFEGDAANTRGGAFVDPLTGMADPTLQRPKGQITLPLAPGMTIVRYWIGLRDPLRKSPISGLFSGYLEPFSRILQANAAGRDNLYVLYRAEVQPFIWSVPQNKFVVNKGFFYDLDRDNDGTTTGPLFDDPTFFDPAVNNPAYTIPDPSSPDPTKEQMVQNWVAKAVIQTEVSRYDMIQPVYDIHTHAVTYDGDAPRMQPLVQFKPTRISSEPATGQAAIRLGEESENSAGIAPDVFRTKYGGWSGLLVRIYPSGYVSPNPYQVGVALSNPVGPQLAGFHQYMYLPSSGFDDVQVGKVPAAAVELFDTDIYLKGLKQGFRANFARALASANSRSGWLTNVGYRTQFLPFVPDMNRGKIIGSFDIGEMGVVSATAPYTPIALPDPVNNPYNLPGLETWSQATAGAGDPAPNEPKTPLNDYPRNGAGEPDLSAGAFSDAQYNTINRRFNKIWFDHPELRPNNVHRFLDLRVTRNSDGAISPISPDPATGFSSASIVPGSEQVFGPDQNPGPNYGHKIRYVRTTRDPGPNQYRINYTDLAEPDYSLLGQANPPLAYTPTDFSSAVIQPRYRAGYVQFNSDPNVPLPGDDPATTVDESKILVYYRFQFTHPKDVIAVDYDSRQVMSVLVTIRNYPQSSLPNPQTVTLRSTAEVRNFLR